MAPITSIEQKMLPEHACRDVETVGNWIRGQVVDTNRSRGGAILSPVFVDNLAWILPLNRKIHQSIEV